MERFIYVFDEHSRDTLLKLGYHLLKTNNPSGVFVFENNAEGNYSHANIEDSVRFIKSNTLTF